MTESLGAPTLKQSINQTFGDRVELITVKGNSPYWCVYIHELKSEEELIQLDSLIKAVCPKYTGWAAENSKDKFDEILKELTKNDTYEYIRLDKKWFK